MKRVWLGTAFAVLTGGMAGRATSGHLRDAPRIPDPARAGSGHSGKYRLVAPGFWGYADDTVPERDEDTRTLLAAGPSAIAPGLPSCTGGKSHSTMRTITHCIPDMPPGGYRIKHPASESNAAAE
ncbi:hypothetical protein [Acidithiobacillus ferrianus]|uniref:hypothetical protein n=1 Tax=Acidithiobacillus ferrianus TaxID=2678518 RepID=UPI0034E466AB